MAFLRRAARGSAATLLLAAAGACSGNSLGNVLGSVLGGGAGQGGQVSGTIQNVDTRSQQIAIRQSNGQTVALSFDNQTQVVYQNQNYPVTALEYGDQVTARVQSSGNGYYTDLVQVDQSVSNSTGGATSSGAGVQALQGTVRQVDQSRGLFAMDANNVTLTVSLPYNPSRADLNRFQSLRAGDYVRFYGVFLNNTRVELRQFY